MYWVNEEEENLKNETNQLLRNFHNMEMFQVAKDVIKQNRWLWH
jgi:hypothetical protein